MIKRLLLPLICIMLVLSTGGVYATWLYAGSPIQPAEQEMMLSLAVFEYKPEEILPGGEMEEAVLGEDHYGLIDLILNEREKGYGLNISNNVVDNFIVYCLCFFFG